MPESTVKEKNNTEEVETPIDFNDFLESFPPSSLAEVGNLALKRQPSGSMPGYFLNIPEIQLHCGSASCNGLRFFRNAGNPDVSLLLNQDINIYLAYYCANCRSNFKTFAIRVSIPKAGTSGVCYKYGEYPNYGPPTPSKLIKLIGPDRELFLQGRRCENQGLGIGAFVYYRRVIESQKNRILDEIIKVSEKLGVSAEKIQALNLAKQETQFSKAIDSVKDAIPQALLINGHNPLLLLHSALSDGLHERTDDYCLELANSIRVILAELSEKLSQALKDEAELNHAVSRLLGNKT